MADLREALESVERAFAEVNRQVSDSGPISFRSMCLVRNYLQSASSELRAALSAPPVQEPDYCETDETAEYLRREEVMPTDQRATGQLPQAESVTPPGVESGSGHECAAAILLRRSIPFIMESCPRRPHEGPCGPEAGCDATCMDVAAVSDLLRAIKEVLAHPCPSPMAREQMTDRAMKIMDQHWNRTTPLRVDWDEVVDAIVEGMESVAGSEDGRLCPFCQGSGKREVYDGWEDTETVACDHTCEKCRHKFRAAIAAEGEPREHR